MIGMPFKARSCFRRSAFMRRPKPAAAMIAPTFIGNSGGKFRERELAKKGTKFTKYLLSFLCLFVANSPLPEFRLVRYFRLGLPFRRTFRARFSVAVALLTLFTRWMMRYFRALLLIPAKDHLAGSCLQHARHGRLDGFSDHFARIVHHDHRTVVKVCDTLIEFFSFFQNEYF